MERRKGILITFFGPDGSGKSTVIAGVKQSLAGEFDDVMVQHLFPNAGETGNQPPVTDPHTKSPRRVLDSYPKMALWGWRFSVGYLRHIRPRRARSTLILFDRYFLDIIVDPKRYRYGGPSWLPNLIWKFLPKPDLVFLLDATTEVLQRRKQEVPLAETRRQVLAYQELVGDMKNGHIIDASQPIDDVVAAVDEIILNFIVTRTRRCHQLDVPR